MENTEQRLLQEIRDLYHKLLESDKGTYIGTTKIGEPGFGYATTANELFKKVHELYCTFHPKYLDEITVGHLMHTINKEVEYVELSYKDAKNPKASQKKKRAVCTAINNANDQIKLDLFALLKKIGEL